jgi:hypothetical protein
MPGQRIKPWSGHTPNGEEEGIVSASEFNETETKSDHVAKAQRQPYRVHLPGFITEEDIGLGDIIKHATSAVGIQTCGGCTKRAAMLNRWFVFSGKHPK